MKPSKNAIFDYFLGLIVIAIGAIVAIVQNDPLIFIFGETTCCVLFVFGVQTDLYKKDQDV